MKGHVDSVISDPTTEEVEDVVEIENAVTVDEEEFRPGTMDNPYMYDASVPDREKFLLTCIFVDGKNASIQRKKLDEFINCVKRDLGSYSVDELGVISAVHNILTGEEVKDRVMGWLKEVRAGQYSRICSSILDLCNKVGGGKIDLKNCMRKKLITIKGIGPKTASMFMLYTVRDINMAVLDTHILRWLREEKGYANAPESSPQTTDEYVRWEKIFLHLASVEGKSPADLDFEIWSKYRNKQNVKTSNPIPAPDPA